MKKKLLKFFILLSGILILVGCPQQEQPTTTTTTLAAPSRPYPADKSTIVPTNVAYLEWDAIQDSIETNTNTGGGQQAWDSDVVFNVYFGIKNVDASLDFIGTVNQLTSGTSPNQNLVGRLLLSTSKIYANLGITDGKLEKNKIYYWKVEAVYESLSKTSSPIWSFTTLNFDSPSYTAPANGIVDVSVDTTLSWGASFGQTSFTANVYDIYFGSSLSPSLVKSNSITTSYTPPTLLPNTTYYWYIVAKNTTANTSITGPTWTFKTMDKLSYSSPLNNAIDIATNSSLSWNSTLNGVTNISADLYDIYLGTTNPPNLFKANLTSATFTPTEVLASDTTYYWYIIAKNSRTGQSLTGPVWAFKTTNHKYQTIDFNTSLAMGTYLSGFGLATTGSQEANMGNPYPSLLLANTNTLGTNGTINPISAMDLTFDVKINTYKPWSFDTNNNFQISTGTFGTGTGSPTSGYAVVPWGRYISGSALAVNGRNLDRLYRLTSTNYNTSGHLSVLSTSDKDFLYSKTTYAVSVSSSGTYRDTYGSNVTGANYCIPQTIRIKRAGSRHLRFDQGYFYWANDANSNYSLDLTGGESTGLDGNDDELLASCYTYSNDVNPTVGGNQPGYTIKTGLSDEQLSDAYNILKQLQTNGLSNVTDYYDGSVANDTTYVAQGSGTNAQFKEYNYVIRTLNDFDKMSVNKTYAYSAANRNRARAILESVYDSTITNSKGYYYTDDTEAKVDFKLSFATNSDKYFVDMPLTIYFDVTMDCTNDNVYVWGTYFDDKTEFSNSLNITRTTKIAKADTGKKMGEWIPVKVSFNFTAGTYTVSVGGVAKLNAISYDQRTTKIKVPTKIDSFTITSTSGNMYLDNLIWEIKDTSWLKSVMF
ncbi:MAG: hypothetical protein A2Y34_13275 [Spirochaetes bacterium GWC1_27_15]|nr:MAG: hypothetical protein A2Y34_13275 [Spirochaetes bacterium GWC1_27_15]